MKKDWFILDYISWEEVKSTPEEVDAVQVFSKQLIEDYWYCKEQIQTRPQFRVKARPSDTTKTYPVDIAVFKDNSKNEDDVFIIIECKKRNRKDWRTQLEDYLRLSKAELWVWFNGDERLFIRKIEKAWKVLFEEIPNIPKKWQRVEDIGKFKKWDLKPTHNLKSVFKSIRNHLAWNTTWTTRDEAIAQQLINLIFCKIFDEKYTKSSDIVRFRAWIEETSEEIKYRILDIFKDVKIKLPEVLDASDEIILDANSISYVVWELQNYALMQTERDVIADAFETFIWHALKWAQWQFFTPRNVVKMMVEILEPKEDEMVIDPSCWSWGFLIDVFKFVSNKIETKWKEFGWSDIDIEREYRDYASEHVRWIDKDYFLSKVAKAYMTLVWDWTSWIFCEDSLEKPENWWKKTQVNVWLWQFNIVLTNPPFGSKIPVKWEDKLKQFEFWHKWKFNKKSNLWEKWKLAEKESPQTLFIERCLHLLKDNWRMAVVLPDWIYWNDKLWYIRKYLIDKARIIAIIDVPIETFMPNTSTKTSILVLQKLPKEKIPSDYKVFMAIAETCWHDRRWNIKEEDDILKIADEFKKWKKNQDFEF